MPRPPDPRSALRRLKQAVRLNERPATLLHQFLASGTKEANLIANYLIDYRQIIEYITSPEGRKWLHYWLDDTLNYLEKYAKEATK